MIRTLALPLIALLVATACGGGTTPGGGATAVKLTDGKVVIAVINDQSGVYADLSGKNAVEAVNMAIADFKAKYGDNALGGAIEVLSADHKNDPALASSKAQEFYERSNADLILDVPTSSAALAIAKVANDQKKLYINVTAASTDLTGPSCNKYTFHYAYDTYMLAVGTGTAVVSGGGKKWYIIYPNYAFGQDMEKSFRAAVQGAGGTVVQSDGSPFPNQTGDFSSDTDITALGQDAFAGDVYTTPWIWSEDEAAKAFADKFLNRTKIRPTFAHAANYSATFQYLEAIRRAGGDDADAVVKALEGYKFSDFFIHNGLVRPEDHWVMHDAFLAQVKSKAEAKEPFDYSKIISTIPADKASRPLAEAGCKMAK